MANPFSMEALQQKAGPLPVWEWALLGGGGLAILLYLKSRAGASSQPGAVPTILNPALQGGGGGGGGGYYAPPPAANAPPDGTVTTPVIVPPTVTIPPSPVTPPTVIGKPSVTVPAPPAPALPPVLKWSDADHIPWAVFYPAWVSQQQHQGPGAPPADHPLNQPPGAAGVPGFIFGG
jgi:hypothetical protein